MMINTHTLVWIVIAWLMIAFFSGIEVAFASANKLAIELKKKQGLSSGIILSNFVDHPAQFLGTSLVGFNVFLVIFGLMVGETFLPLWNWLITKIPYAGSYVNAGRLFVETLVASVFILFFGEFIPRALFRSKSDSLLSFFASAMDLFSRFFSPIAGFFAAISQWVLKYVFNVRMDERRGAFSLTDVEHFMQQAGDTEEDAKGLNKNLIEAALRLPKVKVRECLVPRKEIDGIDLNAPIEEARKKFVDTRLSKLVVYDENLDHVVGYIHQLDLFKAPPFIKTILHPIPAVPESMSATDLISKFSRERKSIAWVVDEFGGTAGIVTMEDLLEEIFGEIKDEYDTEEFEERKLSADEFIFSGRLELDYLNEKYHLELPQNGSETLSGYIINQHETIPHLKDRIIIGDYEFEILNVSDTRIEMVRLKVLK
ncbi:hemolysin family protein [Flavitalea sp. BT771]|uniref:hemolysin family protein n=1 Tax=Flavitalea sp. BT771 TaxID=3063329 RepID=UPI0026E12838|nr:hemolysin family protein [Flavitalea sp. BT771]MDO6434314.1 hemolysin family protein [Flavitalea sp. BT771]MDV6223214.1 hemolysin family protein [Flavitalea sp. BT771]